MLYATSSSTAAIITEQEIDDPVHGGLTQLGFRKSHQGKIERLDGSYMVVDYLSRHQHNKTLVFGFRSPGISTFPTADCPILKSV